MVPELVDSVGAALIAKSPSLLILFIDKTMLLVSLVVGDEAGGAGCAGAPSIDEGGAGGCDENRSEDTGAAGGCDEKGVGATAGAAGGWANAGFANGSVATGV